MKRRFLSIDDLGPDIFNSEVSSVETSLRMNGGLSSANEDFLERPSLIQGVCSADRIWPETGMWEIAPGKWASIRQPHWHRHLDVKRPNRSSG